MYFFLVGSFILVDGGSRVPPRKDLKISFQFLRSYRTHFRRFLTHDPLVLSLFCFFGLVDPGKSGNISETENDTRVAHTHTHLHIHTLC